MDDAQALAEYREAVLQLLETGVGAVVAGMALLLLLVAIAVVRHI